ncbi:Ubiquitin carboxyl-terminal hydrolase [Candida maltosa Xu316]|uniref:Ubiquitin carboxyl-terminal hydrolase n=1 Tax=Candida maltosa (strain Xu316) TaxID=1245528 RepID=M3HH44_CANMX|nr:Ubiquitin carboxyl-terminal hydrolase [Candida maltosa Xu316]
MAYTKAYDIELQQDDNGKTLKEKIQQLTLIPPERQKILIKGGKLTDDVIVSTLDLKNPVMVLGTPDKNLPSKPVEKQVFLEDLNKNQLVKVGNEPSGLTNLGNTCYLNSSLQTLFQMEDVQQKVKSFDFSVGVPGRTNDNLVLALNTVFSQMSKKQEAITPSIFLSLFRRSFPQFAEQQNGIYKQQDAEEAFSQILSSLRATLKIDDLFRIDFQTETKCLALPEDVTTGFEEAFKLNCHIDVKTNFLRDGILAGLKETIEKHNSTLNADTDYEITKTITRLPKYLTVHFIRFFWKRDINKKSKILRRVQFPFELDVAEMLDSSVKPEKIANRDTIRKVEKDNLDLVRDFKKAKKDSTLTPLEQQEEDEMKITSIKSKFKDDLATAIPNVNFETSTENPSSVYELNAVITHAGASADGGHYKAYVKDPTDLDGDRWWLFNDDKVSSVNKEKIETLAGGGESDAALLLIYKGLGL